jgi:hypothetical protein
MEAGSRPAEYSSAGLVAEAGTIELPGIPVAEAPAPSGPVISPDYSAIGGGPTDAGAETIADIIALSYADLVAYWCAHWSEGYPAVAYTSPPPVGTYDSSLAEIPDASCFDPTSDPIRFRLNAFYCYGDQSISYDVVMADQELRDIGDFAVVGTVAHEWGHHLQNLIFRQPSDAQIPIFSIESELQADCFAGIYTHGAGEAGTFPVSVADIEEAAVGFYQSGSAADYGWFEPVYHGTPEERHTAFMHGHDADGVRACEAYAIYMEELTVRDGPYAIGVLAGSQAETDAAGRFAIVGGPYGDVRVIGDTLTVQSGTYEGSIEEALAAWAPGEGGGIGLEALGETHDYTESTLEWGIPGATVGFYFRSSEAEEYRYGYIMVHASNGPDVLILEASVLGNESQASWAQISSIAGGAVRSFQMPGPP